MATYALAKKFTNEQIIQKATNSPTQKITFDSGIYSLPSNVVNGQVSDCRILGLTVTNIIENGNFSNGVTGWNTLNVTLSALNNECVANVTQLATTAGIYSKPYQLTQGHKYYIKGFINPKYTASARIGFGTTYATVGSLVANAWNKVSTVQTATTTEQRGFLFYHDTSSQYVVDDTFKIKDMFVVNLTSAFGAGNEPTVEQCDKIFANWFSGTKSTNSVRLVSVGKNLIKPFTSNVWSLHANTTVIDDYTLELDATADYQFSISEPISIIPNANYTLSCESDANTYSYIKWYDAGDNFLSQTAIAGDGSKKEVTVTAPSNASYATIDLKNANGFTGKVRFVRPQFKPSNTSSDFEPHKESIAYINWGASGEGRSVGNANDEVSVSEGKATQNVSDELNLWKIAITSYSSANTDNYYAVTFNNIIDIASTGANASAMYRINNYGKNAVGWLEFFSADAESSYISDYKLFMKIPKTAYAGTWTLGETQAWLQSKLATLTYQLANPIVTNIPKQKLEVFENGTVWVELLSEPGESTNPIIEIEVPIGDGNQLGIAEHDFKAAAADWVLTTNESKCVLLKATNAGDVVNIVAPSRPRMYIVENSSGQTVTVKTAESAGVEIATDTTKFVVFNSEDYMEVL